MSGMLHLSALVLLCGVAVQSSPMNTCDVQSNCLKVTMGPATSSVCASQSACAWRVCVTLDLDSTNPKCAKGSGTVSHTCKKSDSTCGGGDWSSAAEVTGLPDGFNMCQTGVPGQTLQFLLKDGSGCGNSHAALNVTGAGRVATMQCAPSITRTCTGNGIGVECIWSVQLPAACPVTPGLPVTGAGSVDTSSMITVSGSTTGAIITSGSAVADSSGSSTGAMASGDMVGVATGDMVGVAAVANPSSSPSPVHLSAEDCALLESALPQRMLAFESDDIPTCDINGALALLGGPYECEQPSEDCLFLQCRQPIPESTLADLKTMKC